MNTWRDRARPIIAEVIGCFSPGDDVKVIKKAVMATYPFGERRMWPYKVWCDEVRRQLEQRQRSPLAPQQPHETMPLFASGSEPPVSGATSNTTDPVTDPEG